MSTNNCESCDPSFTCWGKRGRCRKITPEEKAAALRAAEDFDTLTKSARAHSFYHLAFAHVNSTDVYRIECDDGAGVLSVCLGVDGDMHATVYPGPRAEELGHFGSPGYRARTHTGGGRCERVRKALLLLALAIKADAPNR
jgi:hypothetical protein